MFKKALKVGIFCLLILMFLPSVTGEFFIYPKEEGPYTVFIAGNTYGGAVSKPILINSTKGVQFGPFCKYNYPYGPEYNMLNWSIFIVNGKIQNYEFPAQIGLKGLTGFAPAINQLTIKVIIGGRIRILGFCDEIYLWYGLNP